jgi:ATP-dependent Clp protease ATP-binding subunit ClpC
MFERYSEDARRALFFARANTTQRRGDSITPEDLLGGIIWASPHLLARFGAQPTNTVTPNETAEDFMSRLDEDPSTLAHSKKEIRFLATTQLALERAAEEADELRHKTIGPEHLLLGILREEKSQAWRTLDEAGVTLREVRRIMAQKPGEQT